MAMKKTLGVTVLLVWALGPASVLAQQAPLVVLAPENPARWDAAGFTGWFGGHRSGTGLGGNDWSDAALAGVSTGYYWMPHIRIGGDAAITTWGNVFVQEQTGGRPGSPSPSYRFGEERFSAFHASATLAYQFLLNTWVHPFVAAGVDGSREWSRRDLHEQAICTSGPCPRIQLPRESTETTRIRPIAAVGVTWYLTERAFLRSEIRAGFSTGRVEAVQWRAGIGADF